MKKYGELVLQKQAAYLSVALEMSPIKMLMKLTPGIHESNSGLYKYRSKRTTIERKGETVKLVKLQNAA
jgi:hypothetical protein